MPKWYPIVGIIFSLFYLAGLILFSAWLCKDSYGTRATLKIGGYLILGSTVFLIFLAVGLILFWDKEHENIKVGNGDDDDDYVEMSRGTYILNYLIGGLVIIAVVVSLIILAFGYDDSFPPEEDTSPEEEKKMMEAM